MRSVRVLFVLVAFALPFTPSIQAQSVPEPIPGVHIPKVNVPWAVDVYSGKPELVPILHTVVKMNSHSGANVVGALAGSFFYKPKITIEIEGAHARVALHTGKPVFYVHVMSDPDDDQSSFIDHWAIVQAVVKKNKRTISQIRFTQLTGNAKRDSSGVEVTVETLAGGWLKITPDDPLTPGEYALLPVMEAANSYSAFVYDFTLNPKAPNAPDALSASKP